MIYLVPVTFRIEADSADHAQALIEKVLNTCNTPHTVYQGNAESVKDIKVSAELANYLDEVITDNDNDTNGWETDLDWCLQYAEDSPLAPELATLIAQVGGEVKAANFTPD